jgi:bifunctional non-homologous end joining protein LigD
MMSLTAYRKKRNFDNTGEPNGAEAAKGETRRFVVQEHHARQLHFDFRVEFDGVLKSWAVPKGFPEESGVRRLAIMTEDHPLEYLTFAGTIPKGNYGAGEMSVWDTGTYESVADDDFRTGLESGKLELVLHGHRLNAQFDMIRTDAEKNEWILIKAKTSMANVHAEPAESGSNDTPSVPGFPIGTRSMDMPDASKLSPMLAESAERAFSGTDWQFEIKWDGYRAFLFMLSDSVEFYSRNHLKLGATFPQLSKINDYVNVSEAIIDGEIVALDSEGKPNFQALQNRLGFKINRSRKRQGQPDPPLSKLPTDVKIVFIAFDIIFANGKSFVDSKLVDRRNFLRAIIKDGGPIRFSDHIIKEGEELFHKVQQMGLEGVMAKRIDSLYVEQRSANWKKIRVNQSLDAVIGGYTESKSGSRPFGSLVVGQYDGSQLVFVGHVGTGYDQKMMSVLMESMRPLEVATSPFTPEPDVNGTPHWLKPSLVCEVKYSNITDNGIIRHPVFVRTRPDKPPEECRKSGGSSTSGSGTGLNDVLASRSSTNDTELAISIKSVKLTHLDKIYWNKTGTSKRDLLRYYESVSEYLLPHLKDRPIVLERYPNGVDGGRFFQHDIGVATSKHPGAGHIVPPEFLRTFNIEESSGMVHYALCDNLAGLMYVANLGTIPIHCWNITVKQPENPDRVIFDLDPGEDFTSSIQVATYIKNVLDAIGLDSYPKTSGANGMHVYVPIKPEYSATEVVDFAKMVADTARQQHPDLITLERRIKNRGATKVYVDCVQNGLGKTVVAPYSVRAMEIPSVSTPLMWDELADGIKISDYTIETVLERLSQYGDLFRPMTDAKQNLKDAYRRINDFGK